MRHPVAIVALLAATPAFAQSEVATPQQASEAIAVCKSIATPSWIELKRLKDFGWAQVSKPQGRGRVVVRGAYAHATNPALIVIGRDELSAKSCVVSALLASGAEYGAMAQGVSAQLGMPTSQNAYTYIWERDGFRVQIDPAGERDAPRARFEIRAIKGG